MTLSSIIDQLNSTMAPFQILANSHRQYFAFGWRYWHHEYDAYQCDGAGARLACARRLARDAADITKQFLCESILLCISGGVVELPSATPGVGFSGIGFSPHAQNCDYPYYPASIVAVTSGIYQWNRACIWLVARTTGGKLNPISRSPVDFATAELRHSWHAWMITIPNGCLYFSHMRLA